MIIFPAIDIKDGQVVRLRQGRFDDITVYSTEPLVVAQKWASQGAAWLHVVDLDGAKTGEMKNFEQIAAIAKAVNIPIEVGGGVRNHEDIEKLFVAGVQRAIISTRAVNDPDFLTSIIRAWPQRIAVSVDCINGLVTRAGWTETTSTTGIAFARQLQDQGLQYLIYTDIKRDGMLAGPNLEGLQEMLNSVHLSVIASGGVSDLKDIQRLLDMKAKNLLGVITGKAIYEGNLDLQTAIELCSRNV